MSDNSDEPEVELYEEVGPHQSEFRPRARCLSLLPRWKRLHFTIPQY